MAEETANNTHNHDLSKLVSVIGEKPSSPRSIATWDQKKRQPGTPRKDADQAVAAAEDGEEPNGRVAPASPKSPNRRSVSWQDMHGKDLAQVREFEPPDPMEEESAEEVSGGCRCVIC
eukprot:jgi/Chlat1/102/Chrsp1S03210